MEKDELGTKRAAYGAAVTSVMGLLHLQGTAEAEMTQHVSAHAVCRATEDERMEDSISIINDQNDSVTMADESMASSNRSYSNASQTTGTKTSASGTMTIGSDGRSRRRGSKQSTKCLEAKWDQMYLRLVQFKMKNGHCLVPNRYAEDRSLGAWVSTQRRQYKVLMSASDKSTPMTLERARQLNEIGFVWSTTDPRNTPWQKRYEQLCEFYKNYGMYSSTSPEPEIFCRYIYRALYGTNSFESPRNPRA